MSSPGSPPSHFNLLLSAAVDVHQVVLIQSHIRAFLARRRVAALRARDQAVLSAFLEARFDVCAYLIAHGADLTRSDPQRNTILHLACRDGRIDIVRAVLERHGSCGGCLAMENEDGETALHVAVRSGHDAVLGAFEARHCRADPPPSVSAQVLGGGSPPRGDGSRLNVLAVERRGGRSALHLAVEAANAAAVRMVRRLGGNTMARDADGRTCFDYADALPQDDRRVPDVKVALRERLGAAAAGAGGSHARAAAAARPSSAPGDRGRPVSERDVVRESSRAYRPATAAGARTSGRRAAVRMRKANGGGDDENDPLLKAIESRNIAAIEEAVNEAITTRDADYLDSAADLLEDLLTSAMAALNGETESEDSARKSAVNAAYKEWKKRKARQERDEGLSQKMEDLRFQAAKRERKRQERLNQTRESGWNMEPGFPLSDHRHVRMLGNA